MAYITIAESDLDANSGLIESVTLQITRNLEDHEDRIQDLELYLGAEIWTAKTTDYSLLTTDVNGNYAFSNDGAVTAITFTLPSATSGMRVTIANVESQTLTVKASSGDGIYFQGQSISTQISTTVKGNMIVLWCTNDTEWVALTETTFTAAGRAVFQHGLTSSAVTNVMDYVNIAVPSNATDFGDITVALQTRGGLSSATRGVWGGGQDAGSSNVMDYITLATTGNAIDFGDLYAARGEVGGLSNTTRGIFFSGGSGSGDDTMEYITIASTSNTTDFGNLLGNTRDANGVCNSNRGVVGGGYSSSTPQNVLQYVTVSSTGNATDFGDLTQARSHAGRADSSVYGLFAGGNNGAATLSYNIIDYITIGTTGNATDFGDLTQTRDPSGTSSATRGVFGGGFNSGGSEYNIIDYVTIASVSNATDFGDQSQTNRGSAACSDAHGGLSV